MEKLDVNNINQDFLQVRVILQSIEAANSRIKDTASMIQNYDSAYSNEVRRESILKACKNQEANINNLKMALSLIFEQNGKRIESK